MANIAQEKTYLAIPFEERKDAFRAAGKLPDGKNALGLDEDSKLWFANPGADLDKLKKWIPDTTRRAEQGETDPVIEFGQALEDAGFILDGEPEMDGKKHRVSTVDDRGGQKSGVYVGYLDGVPAGWYQDHRIHSEPQKWKATGNRIDPEAQAHLKAVAAQRKIERDQAQAKQYDHNAHRSQQAASLMPDAQGQEQYLVNKGVKAFPGVKSDKRGRVVIPLQNEKGEIRTLQRISGNGFKSLKKNGQKSGSYFVVGGELKNGDPILYAEGYSTSATISDATGRPVVMTVDAGNMPTVAAKLLEKYPDSQHVFLADDDRKNTSNKGKEKAEQAATITNGIAQTPIFNNQEIEKGLSDFNDLGQSRGLEVVRKQVETILNKVVAMDKVEENTVSNTERGNETIKLYHGSPAQFSEIDPNKIGLGQNFVGRGFYTDTSVLGVHYAMEEINHQDYYVYEIEIPSNSIILDRYNNASLTDEVRQKIKEAGVTIGSRDQSYTELADSLANSKNIDDTFLMKAGSIQGGEILKEAGITAIKDNSYMAIIDTSVIDNIRLHTATGNKATEINKYIDNALVSAKQEPSRLNDALNKHPSISNHFTDLKSEIEKLSLSQSDPEKTEKLISLLTHTLVDGVDKNINKKTEIAPLNILYAEAIRSLGLNDHSAVKLGNLVNSTILNIEKIQKVDKLKENTGPVVTDKFEREIDTALSNSKAALNNQEQAAAPAAAPNNQEQAAAPAAALDNQEQAAAPAAALDNQEQAAAPAAVLDNQEQAAAPAAALDNQEQAAAPAAALDNQEQAAAPAAALDNQEQAAAPAAALDNQEQAAAPAAVLDNQEQAAAPAAVLDNQEQAAAPAAALDNQEHEENAVEPFIERKIETADADVRAWLTNSRQPIGELIEEDERKAQNRPQAEGEFSSEPSQAPKGQASNSDFEATTFKPIVPEKVAKSYIEVDGKYYFGNRPDSLAFVDKGAKLQTKLSSEQVAASMVDIAEARGWTELQLSGTEDFRRAAWLEAASRGLASRGYKPKEEDLARLKKLTNDRTSNEIEPREQADVVPPAAKGKEQPTNQDKQQGQQAAQSPQVAKAAAATATADKQQPEAVAPAQEVNRLAGKLVEHGKAPYENNPDNNGSYFVTLENADGQQSTTWGVGLEKAIEESQAEAGQHVELENLGRKPVQVEKQIKDEQGNVTGTKTVNSYRNEWAVKAEAIRDSSRDAKELVKEHPDLINEITAVKLAEKFAAANLSAADQARFMERVRGQVADNVSTGQQAPELKIREETTIERTKETENER
ncbi:LPD7 domain-containing protein [Citrobacter sp. RHBSTW-00821]|uniref:LPD7 domain-containing protein n=1 Tax=Citrobacter sp. RHBSTW-00821 TaxID=2742663 RepID=UPI0015EA91C6|nr:LPD7 domain-containing protein [Citrobacter sp. RHBSTW-00821]QLT57111.1 hypothetical protein HV285_28015 [Citrobacter sp. RHBSTW-00821]